jgi:threonine aldolase
MPFPDGTADFRSDTVTRPTREMLEAMSSAPVGDDVYSDDPTVNLLEEESAAVTGKEAALYVPTGTMGNQLSIMAQTHPGEEVLAHEGSHVRSIEAGAPQALSGVGFRTVSGDGGRIEPEDVERAMALSGFFPRIGLMVWENTHNLSGGRVIPIDVMEKTSEVARAHGLSIHVDGARIFNAVIASGVTAELRYLRKRLGGGMRQAGVIAAAARVALAGRDRLVDDHALARRLGDEIAARFPGSLDSSLVETNMVRLDFSALGIDWAEMKDRLDGAGIKVNPPIAGSWRIVTHRDVDSTDVERLLGVLP